MAQYAYVYINHTHLYNWSPSPCYLTIAVLNDCYSEVMAYTALACSYWVSFHKAYVYLYHTHSCETISLTWTFCSTIYTKSKASLITSFIENMCMYRSVNYISCRNTFSVKKVRQSKVESYLEVNIWVDWRQQDLILDTLGMRTLCWNNFGNNRMQKESRIMLK